MKNVVLEERRERFEKLLTKICKDFKIVNSKEVIQKFLKDNKNYKKRL